MTTAEVPRVLFKRPEAYRMLGIGPTKYKELVSKGLLHEVKIGVRGKRLPASEVERFIRERTEARA